ncbi:MAG: hypothetical protein KDK39_07870 [Leptospiraceae bacterium]|nr:hypothetical protein [Leptospiraceae bacterium]
MSAAFRKIRILKPLVGFQAADDQMVHEISDLIELNDADEVILGIYKNHASLFNNAILITTNALYLVSEHLEVQPIQYSSIQEVQLEGSKDSPTGIRVFLDNKDSVSMAISGCKNYKHYDAFEFLRFLMRILDGQ